MTKTEEQMHKTLCQKWKTTQIILTHCFKRSISTYYFSRRYVASTVIGKTSYFIYLVRKYSKTSV